MNAVQIRNFVETARQGSFSGAAKAQSVSFQAVAKSIRQLEKEIGAPLFVRESNGVSLTEEGKALFPMALKAVQGYEAVAGFVEGNSRPARSAASVNIGCARRRSRASMMLAARSPSFCNRAFPAT